MSGSDNHGQPGAQGQHAETAVLRSQQDHDREEVHLVDGSKIGVTVPDVGRQDAELDDEHHEREALVGGHGGRAQRRQGDDDERRQRGHFKEPDVGRAGRSQEQAEIHPHRIDDSAQRQPPA